MKNIRTIYGPVMLLISVISSSCTAEKQRTEVTQITLSRSYVSLTKGNEATLTAQILPYNATDQALSWQSDHPQVATVSSAGKVMAMSAGHAVITVRSGDATATCRVTVKTALIGVYYFDGWSGVNSQSANPGANWAVNAPTHLTKRLFESFPEREPLWGWRNDTQEIMERQIDLASDNGVDFFLFCWYWQNNRGYLNESTIRNDSKHKSLALYLTAANKQNLQFCLLIANHAGSEIIGSDNWADAVRHWMPYFRDPQYTTVDGKPLVVLFGTGDETITDADIAKMQETAVKEGLKNGLAIAGCGANATVRRKTFTHSTHYNLTSGYSDGSREQPYQLLIDRAKPQWTGTVAQPYMPVINSGWDKRPWEGPDGMNQVEGWYFTGDTPELFQGFLRDAIGWMNVNPIRTTRERIVLIYAWNELGEGGYLVPTKGDTQAAKLKKIKELLDE